LKIIIDRCIEALPAGGSLDIELSRGEAEIAVRFSFGGHTVLGEEEGAAATSQPRDIELALVMRMLKQQGGQIVREERPDGGATYSVILPDNKENDHG
jgi:hypothetical protein